MVLTSHKPRYSPSTDADQVRVLLKRAHLDQREAARVLEISERGMRCYCTGEKAVPRVVILALERLADLEACGHAEAIPVPSQSLTGA